jgi:hypothetical protein
MGTTPAIPADAASNRGVYEALEALRAMLIPGEELEAMAIQRRIFALFHRRRAVGATSGRVIVVQRKLFGGYVPIDFRWQDLRESEVDVGALSATLSLSAYRSSDLATNEGPPSRLVVAGLRKSEAQEVYRVCQAQSQAWREKRRVRELEELRAKSGGIQVGSLGSPAAAQTTSGGAADNSPTARLQRAKEMRASGLLNDAEFEQIKARILAEL